MTMTMTEDELLDFAYETVTLRGEMPDELRIEVGARLVADDGKDDLAELFSCVAAMKTGVLLNQNIGAAAWVAATVIVARAERMETAFVSDF